MWFDWQPKPRILLTQLEPLYSVGEYCIVQSDSMPEGMISPRLLKKTHSVLILCSGTTTGRVYAMMNFNRIDKNEIDQMPYAIAFEGNEPLQSGLLIQHANYNGRITPLPRDFYEYVAASGTYPLKEMPSQRRGKITELNIGSPLGEITTEASYISFEIDVNRFELEIKHLLQFSFESYFINDIRQAKMDLIIGWLLRYGDDQLSRVMTPYYLEFKNVDAYIAKFNQHRKTRMKLPVSLPNDKSFSLFQQELKKLPFASRLHFFDFLESSKHGKKSELKHLNGMIPSARRAGVDENESANMLRQSKLIRSFQDGTGFVSPEYLDSATIALDYAKKIAPVYYEWKSEVTGLISDQLVVFVYDSKDPNSGQYVRPDEFED
jgi:hypothetical protein